MNQQEIVVRAYEFVRSDIQAAFYAVATERYGKNCLRGVSRGTLFKKHAPLVLLSIKTGVNDKTTGVANSLVIDGMGVQFNVTPDGQSVIQAYDENGKHRQKIEELLEAVQKHLEEKSIYKGKAITTAGEFLDLGGINEDKIVYGQRVLRNLKSHIWLFIEHPELCAKIGVNLPRKILFQGPYGAGKSLAALLTARRATNHGWTFIYLPPTQKYDDNATLFALEMGRKYQPAVVFLEDLDREQRNEDVYAIGRLASTLDGFASKNSKMIFIASTNFNDKIVASLQRPGRIDKTINFGEFDAENVKELLRKTIPADLLEPTINWDEVAAACKGYPPAFVQEVGKSAALFALAENPDAPRVTQGMLGDAADDLRTQYKKTCDELGFAHRQ